MAKRRSYIVTDQLNEASSAPVIRQLQSSKEVRWYAVIARIG